MKIKDSCIKWADGTYSLEPGGCKECFKCPSSASSCCDDQIFVNEGIGELRTIHQIFCHVQMEVRLVKEV